MSKKIILEILNLCLNLNLILLFTFVGFYTQLFIRYSYK